MYIDRHLRQLMKKKKTEGSRIDVQLRQKMTRFVSKSSWFIFSLDTFSYIYSNCDDAYNTAFLLCCFSLIYFFFAA